MTPATSQKTTIYNVHSTKNKKVLGIMKDECAGKLVIEYVGLRSKMYSIMKDDGNIRKPKSVKKYVVKKQILHENYKETLFDQTIFHHGMNTLRSMNHQLYGLHVNKLSLSPFDS